MPESKKPSTDSDLHKGATEQEAPRPKPSDPETPNSLADQIGHRDNDPRLKDYDSDFPEPDSQGEHSDQR